MNTKYQYVPIALGSVAGALINIEFATEIGYKKVKEICMIAGSSIENNVNFELQKPLTIGTTEVFPELFDTALLFPKKENKEFYEIENEVEADGNVLKTQVKADGTTQNLLIQLKLEK